MNTDQPYELGELGEAVRFDVVEYGEKACVLHVVGEIDTLTAPLLRAQLDTRLGETQLLVLDMTEVGFLGSAGLAVLVAAKEEIDGSGHRLLIVPGSRTVVRALQATGLLTVFETAEGVPQALEQAG